MEKNAKLPLFGAATADTGSFIPVVQHKRRGPILLVHFPLGHSELAEIINGPVIESRYDWNH